MPMGSKDAKRGKEGSEMFHIYSLGLATHRDNWVYNTSTKELKVQHKDHHTVLQHPGS